MTSPTRRHTRRAAACAAALLALAPLAAAAVTPAPLTNQDLADIARIEQYLNAMRTMQARFLQVDPTGGTSQGTLYIMRPGRLLFSYDPPSPIEIIADGTWVHFVDKELKQTTHALIADTTVDFFTRDDLRLSGDITVTGFVRNGSTLNVTLVDSANPDEGQVTFVFDADPLVLREWTVRDPEGQETLVGLLELQPNVSLNGEMFYWYEGNYD